MREDERLEEQIDAALRSYAEAGETSAPRVALARAMARAAQRRSRRRRWFGWCAAAAACTAVFVTAFVTWDFRDAQTLQIAFTPGAPATTPVAQNGFDQMGAHKSGRDKREVVPGHPAPRQVARVRARTPAVQEHEAALPKLAVFPTPRPLSIEERRLEDLAAHAPVRVKLALLRAETSPRPLATVAVFRIRPLNLGENQEPVKEKEELP